VLALPGATVFLPAHQWDVHPVAVFLASLASLAALRLLAGHRLFLLLTYPLALFGAFAVGAQVLRQVDVVELIALGAVRPPEVIAALRPYAWLVAGCAVLLVAAAALAWPARSGLPPLPARRLWLGLVLAVLGLAWWAPGAASRSWPANLLAVTAAHASHRPDLIAAMLPYALVDPRDPGAGWNARREPGGHPTRETYVLVIGESVRADRLRPCGGRAGWAAPGEGRLVFCDVMAASSSTHLSVPLLVSRELPGGPVRVSRDATFLRAFEQSGFRTSWISVQERSIAWPDAQASVYLPLRGTDAAALLPALREQLARPHERQMIVVHAYNAHFPYCDRYDRSRALLAVDCGSLGNMPTPATRHAWLDAYDNAAHESMAFLQAVFEAADARGGEVFLVYTSDHGENLLDDARGLFQHALGEPSRWDTRVPLVVMANDAWRARQPDRWGQLRRNLQRPLMHADVVPTLLGAAQIAYDEPRATVADLTRLAPRPRERLVVRRLGRTVDGDRLE
jgi:glucan phosphoethanolaminetransferase (alkaline phosphatase superfamily)